MQVHIVSSIVLRGKAYTLSKASGEVCRSIRLSLFVSSIREGVIRSAKIWYKMYRRKKVPNQIAPAFAGRI